ncbi:MAG: glycosyltransferase family A protein [Eubacteriales bacterium]|nr:glycosyltransferase family A protein [Eubacteriales bacterium]
MLKQLYRLTTPWGIASKRQLFKNRLLGRLTNYLYPAHCALRPLKARAKAQAASPRVIVTLTTFPRRAGKLHLCLESILRQTRPADLVLLYLAREEFPTPDTVPEPLRRMAENGLIEIRYCENLRSFKKIFFSAQEYPKDILITADDDTFYPEDWIEGLMKLWKAHPDCVCCYRAAGIRLDEKGAPLPYSRFDKLSNGVKGPSFLLLPTGVGGVLYPPRAFAGVTFDAKAVMALCPTADDLWLRAVLMQKGLPVVKARENSTEWFTVLGSQRWSLKDVNVGANGKNDDAMKNLVEAYRLDFRACEARLTGAE